MYDNVCSELLRGRSPATWQDHENAFPNEDRSCFMNSPRSPSTPCMAGR